MDRSYLALSKAPSIPHPQQNQKQRQPVGLLSVNQMAEEDKKRFLRFARNHRHQNNIHFQPGTFW
jgi:hypothetical protein